jgi:hypothetical protein
MTTDHPPNHPGQLVTIVRADRQSTFVEADSDDDDDAVALALGWTCLDSATSGGTELLLRTL